MLHHILWAPVTMAFLEFPQHCHPPFCHMPFVHAGPISPHLFAKWAHTLALSDLNSIINSSAKSSFIASSESFQKGSIHTTVFPFLTGLSSVCNYMLISVIIWWMSFWKQKISFHFSIPMALVQCLAQTRYSEYSCWGLYLYFYLTGAYQ